MAAFTVTAPTEPVVKGNEKHEIHTLSGADAAQTTSGTISAKFLRRIKRALFHDVEVASKVITNTVFPPTVVFTIEAGPTEGYVELIGD